MLKQCINGVKNCIWGGREALNAVRETDDSKRSAMKNGQNKMAQVESMEKISKKWPDPVSLCKYAKVLADSW